MEIPAGTWRIDACLVLSTTTVTSAARAGLNLLSGSVTSCTLMITTLNTAFTTAGKLVATSTFVSGGVAAVSSNTGSGDISGNVLTETGALVTTTGCTIGVLFSNELAADTTAIVAGSHIIAEKLS